MAEKVYGSTFGIAWTELLRRLIERGKVSEPRSMVTKEILNVTLEVENGLANILVNNIRDLNYRFMIAEWLWIQGGLNDVNILAKYNSVMKKFSDDGEILSGAYGPRLMPQIPYVLESLNKPDSRQAVATIWTPSPEDSKDIPCTISLQWMIRGGKVHCTANMRSSDVWLGLPYDFFTFSQLTNYVAMRLGRPVGSVTMNLASSHIYEEHWDKGKLASYNATKNTIWSPHIPRSEPVPDADAIKAMLENDLHTYVGKFWNNYRLALKQDKKFSLEVLSGLCKN
jgi:thymidylate synthase